MPSFILKVLFENISLIPQPAESGLFIRSAGPCHRIFAEGYDKDYEQFKIGVVLKQAFLCRYAVSIFRFHLTLHTRAPMMTIKSHAIYFCKITIQI